MEVKMFNQIKRSGLKTYLWMYIPMGRIKIGKFIQKVGEPEVLKVIPVRMRDGRVNIYDYDKYIEHRKTMTEEDATEKSHVTSLGESVFDELQEVKTSEKIEAYIRHFEDDDFVVDKISM